MTEQNNIPFRDKPEKTAYMWRDIERRAVKYGLAPRLTAPYPLTGLPFANQVAQLGMEEGWGVEFTRAAYHNWFEKGRVPDEGEGLRDSLQSAGQDPDSTIARARGEERAARLEQDTRMARDLGVFGSPSFSVDGEVFWGDDRLDDAIAWARGGHLA